MLRFRKLILSHVLSSAYPPSSTSTSPIFALHRRRPVSTTAPPPNPSFAIQDYLVTTCGLTRPQALKASKWISHVKSPSNPDAVLAFLRGLGVPDAAIPAIVAKDPSLLCASVDKTLAPNVAKLTEFGLSHSEIVRLVPVALNGFHQRSLCRNLRFVLPIFGSFDVFLRAVRCNARILTDDIEKTIKPNIKLLLECGLTTCDIAKLCTHFPMIFSTKPDGLRAMVACAERLGVPRGSTMFKHALQSVAFKSEEKIAAKVEYLRKAFRWSDAQLAIAVSKHPNVLRISEDRLQRVSEFLVSEVGLEPEYIAHRPAMLTYGLESRHRPRYYVFKFLKTNGLLKSSYYSAVVLTEKVFVDKFIQPHKEAAPLLAQDYAAACKGDVRTRFRFE